MKPRTRIFLSALATIVGGSSLILYGKLSRDILFGGLNICSSSDMELIMAGLSLFASAAIAGFIASLIVVRGSIWPHILISAFILGKTSLLLIHLSTKDPVLIETALQFSLLGGLWFGRYSANKFPLAPIS